MLRGPPPLATDNAAVEVVDESSSDASPQKTPSYSPTSTPPAEVQKSCGTWAIGVLDDVTRPEEVGFGLL